MASHLAASDILRLIKCARGLHDLLELLMWRQNIKETSGGKALMWGVTRGYEFFRLGPKPELRVYEHTKRAIQLGADVSAKITAAELWGNHRQRGAATVVTVAAMHPELVDTVELLLSHGAETQRWSYNISAFLPGGMDEAQKKACRDLIHLTSWEVETKEWHEKYAFYSPLALPFAMGQKRMVRLLLDHDADASLLCWANSGLSRSRLNVLHVVA